MAASKFTIYLLNTKLDYVEIIEEFNEDKEPEDHFVVQKKRQDLSFKYITNFELYIREGKTQPDWCRPISQLAKGLPEIQNINYSFVLFIELSGIHFAITGGTGHHVIEKHKYYNFGIDLLSRLIDPNESVIKSVNDRYLTGNRLGSSIQYHGNVSINYEKGLNTFFDKIKIALRSDVIQDKLGIKIETKKKDYRFLATDSVKLGKSLTLNDLDTLLGSIIELLEEDSYPINPFYMLKSSDPRIEELDLILVDQFISYLSNPQAEILNIIPFYYVYDAHFIVPMKDVKVPYGSESDIRNTINDYYSLEIDHKEMLEIIKSIKLVGILEGSVDTEKTLYEHIDIKVEYQDKTYWLVEGNWFLIELEFMNLINRTFLEKVTYSYNHNFNLNQIKNWPDNLKEGEFNISHNEIDHVYVLDKILYNNIEICDLLVEDYQENKLYFVHVKNGLDGEMRVLSAQVEQAIQFISNAEFDVDILHDYYKSIIDKIGNKTDDGEETNQSKAAKKFLARFQTVDEFVDTVKGMKKEFVFAYRPLDSHDINDPTTIKSTAAKLSMLDLTKVESNSDIPINFMRIDR